MKVRPQISTRCFKFLFSTEKIEGNLLRHCLRVLNYNWLSLCKSLMLYVVTFKKAGFVLGADGKRYLVGSGECSRYSHLSLPAPLLSVWIHSTARELEPPVRTGWMVSWKPELQAQFCCLSAVRVVVSISTVTLLNANQSSRLLVRFFLSREACLWALAGQNSVSLCLVRTNSVCQSSAPVTAFQHHADDAGSGYFEWGGQKKLLCLFLVLLFSLLALHDCSYQVPSSLERKAIEAQLLSFLSRLYFWNQICC